MGPDDHPVNKWIAAGHAMAKQARVNLPCIGAAAPGQGHGAAAGCAPGQGGAVYAVATAVREALAEGGEPPVLTLDLRPDLTEAQMVERLSRARQKISTSAFLHRTVGLPPVAKALLHEVAGRTLPVAALTLAQLIKALPLPVTGISGIERAISSAGGIKASEIDAHMMLRQRPGLFAAGEMLDWEAPTGGYLLQACVSTGHAAGNGVLARLAGK